MTPRAMPGTNGSVDKAEIGRLQPLLARLGAGLDAFLRFEHADAWQSRPRWHAAR